MRQQLVLAGTVCLTLASGCAASADAPKLEAIALTTQAVIDNGGVTTFNTPPGNGNGRSCGTCHVAERAFALPPSNVQARLAANPNDPLFQALDADDPKATPLTYNNLQQGLVRIKLHLPDNVDLIQVPPVFTAFAPNGTAQAWWADTVVPGSKLGDALPPGKLPEIITPPDRTIEVWRAVPSIANTAISGPYLFDGRAVTLQDQALGALEGHSQITRSVGIGNLDTIAAFEQTQFTPRADIVFNAMLDAAFPTPQGKNVALAQLGKVNPLLDPTTGFTLPAYVNQVARPEDSDPAFVGTRGLAVYEQFCTACHGKATDDRFEQEAVRAAAIFEVDHAGNVVFQNIPGIGPVPVNAQRPGDEFLNIGTSFLSYIGQIVKSAGNPQAFPTGNQAANLPRYRLRFYTDATRTEQVTDLPPLPAVDPNAPFAPLPNPDGSFTVGPNFGAQVWSTDPGRALITGDYADMEAINIPQLRGIGKTAPYFHDNAAATLKDVVDIYSQFILPAFPSLNPAGVGPGQHAIVDPADRAALVDFLSKF